MKGKTTIRKIVGMMMTVVVAMSVVSFGMKSEEVSAAVFNRRPSYVQTKNPAGMFGITKKDTAKSIAKKDTSVNCPVFDSYFNKTWEKQQCALLNKLFGNAKQDINKVVEWVKDSQSNLTSEKVLEVAKKILIKLGWIKENEDVIDKVQEVQARVNSYIAGKVEAPEVHLDAAFSEILDMAEGTICKIILKDVSGETVAVQEQVVEGGCVEAGFDNLEEDTAYTLDAEILGELGKSVACTTATLVRNQLDKPVIDDVDESSITVETQGDTTYILSESGNEVDRFEATGAGAYAFTDLTESVKYGVQAVYSREQSVQAEVVYTPSEVVNVTTAYVVPELVQDENSVTLDYNSAETVKTMGCAYIGETFDKETVDLNEFLTLGKAYTKVNGSVGYRSYAAPADGKVVPMNVKGYYAFYIKYEERETGLVNQVFYVFQCNDGIAIDDFEINRPIVSQNDNTLMLNYNGVTSISCLCYAYVGKEEPVVSDWATYTALGKARKAINGNKGYEKVNTELVDGYTVDMSYDGYYVTYVKYMDENGVLQEDYAVWECANDFETPEFAEVAEDEKITVTLNTRGYKVISMGYSYTGATAHEFGEWKYYTSFGKKYAENAVNGENQGYIKAYGAKDGEQFELTMPKSCTSSRCFYTCFIKYVDTEGVIQYKSYIYQVGANTPYFSQSDMSSCMMHTNGFNVVSTGYIYTQNDPSGRNVDWNYFVGEGAKFAINSDAEYSNSRYNTYSDVSLKMNYRKAYSPEEGCVLYFDAESYEKETYTGGYYIAFIKYVDQNGDTQMIFDVFDVNK